ncbi:hypothetical protein GGS23DRAFT_556798 [Durotheca rogersii]|uniref:uncharacterized protein n=1 Tax=Durotheca rogersii TaxID=419775 RepID=UPI0022201D05|nr:uncharacterized protein GGS23DRAFT_556798 [Durotheca rogersii]KAI5866372.1 hypothetical protein GGS23DRAFT_556798 [Durotheca rogersii]
MTGLDKPASRKEGENKGRCLTTSNRKAMASFAVSTPSPPGRVHTPGTPKHGYGDAWEPFSPRKSARISARQRSNDRTPSPRASSHHNPTRASRRTASANADTFSTPIASPQKRRLPAMDSVRRASSALTTEGAANAAESLGIGHSSQQKPKANATSSRSAAMLPTPVKTPQKQPDEKSKANVRAIARSLFAEPDIVPSPKKRKTKKYTGLSLESFRAEEVEEPIEIFTDTRDRIPEVGATSDNPFYDDNAAALAASEPSKKRGRQMQITIPGEGKQTIEEAVRRSDGIVSVFRGKKFFRKFASSDDVDSTSQPDIEVEDEDVEVMSGASPFTRSSIKPRLLFPSKQKGKETVKTTPEDEEAETDIEDRAPANIQDEETDTPVTPTGRNSAKPGTPEAPRFAPASPPTTTRTTRSGDKARVEESPVKKAAAAAKPRSPFDGWRRSKSRAASRSLKREGEALPGSNEASKRQRA